LTLQVKFPAKLGISGWYSQCDLPTPDLQESCIGDYVPNYETLALDPTASTCCVNSFVDTTAAAGVQPALVWTHHVPTNQNGVYMYSILLLGMEGIELYKPTNCTING
jgi:hypothetical protein